MSVGHVLGRSGPRKLLALDGGGIRGIISLEVLAAIERLIQDALGRDDTFVLADYFDYIAGTSTGAIIAAALSLGWRVDRIRYFYEVSAGGMFLKSAWSDRIRSKYDHANLSQVLQSEFGAETTLGSDKLQTLLLLLMRNASTNSPWPVSNNPRAMFNDQNRDDSNLSLPLWKLVRASTAAPSYFGPEVIELGRESFVFVDGGVTPYNNPAFQLFLMATIPPYRLCWPTGEDRMLLVSVGTGTSSGVSRSLTPRQMTVLYTASSIPNALIFSAMQEQDLLCRVFGTCLIGDPIDQEVGDLIGVAGPTIPKLFTYLRFNCDLSARGLESLGVAHIKPQHVQALDSVSHTAELKEVGQHLAKRVHPDFFNGFLHVPVDATQPSGLGKRANGSFSPLQAIARHVPRWRRHSGPGV